MASRLVGAAGAATIALSMVMVASFFLIPLPLLLIHAPAYRFCTAHLVSAWQATVSAILQRWYGIRFRYSGERMDGGSPASNLLITNHRTRLDWMLLWPLLDRYDLLPTLHIVLKADIRSMPYIGWACSMVRYIFLNRRWEADVAHFTALLRAISGVPDEPYTVLLFPEGTDLHPSAIEKSAAFAAKTGLPPLTYTLHPRTRGFVHAVQTLRRGARPLCTLYDGIVAFTGVIPQSEGFLIRGSVPRMIEIHMRTARAADLPSDDAGLAAWLTRRFEEKERVLGRFYAAAAAGRPISLSDAVAQELPDEPARSSLTDAGAAAQVAGGGSGGGGSSSSSSSVAFIVTLLLVWCAVAVFYPLVLLGWMVVYSGLMWGLTRFCGGMDRIELGMWVDEEEAGEGGAGSHRD